jgi:hypothetical protein
MAMGRPVMNSMQSQDVHYYRMVQNSQQRVVLMMSFENKNHF